MEDKKKFKGETTMNNGSTALTIISWIFGLAFFAIGLVRACLNFAFGGENCQFLVLTK